MIIISSFAMLMPPVLTGRHTRNEDPTPTLLSAKTKRPCCLTIPYNVAKPSSDPFPIALVVKNGSKMCSIVAESMPRPVSDTLSKT
jgi:hypothetical protein